MKEAVTQLQLLTQEENLDAAVRVGDLYGFLVEHYARLEQWKVVREAYLFDRG